MTRSKLAWTFPIVLLLAFLLGACTGSGDQLDNEGEHDFDSTLLLQRTDLLRITEFKTPTGRTWKVKETPLLDSSLVNVAIRSEGFGEDSVTIDFGEVDPVIAIHMDDLDKNGFQELYVVTQSTDPGAYGTIFGLYSNEDQSISLISYEGASPYTMKEGEPYEGYLGRDHFVFQDGVLTNSFHVAAPQDANTPPDGGTRVITYKLVKGQTAMLLTPVRK